MEKGLRSALQPALYFGVAALVHAAFFLIPGGGAPKPEPSTARGVRVKAYTEGPRAQTAPAAVSAVPPPPPRSSQAIDVSVPGAVSPRAYSMPGGDAPGAQAPAGGSGGDQGGPAGAPGPSQGPAVGAGGPVAQTEYGAYLARLRTDGVQGWARESAKATRQGWKGSGAGIGGDGAGSGKGSLQGTGTGHGSGRGKGGGDGSGSGAHYLDPRVKMVVTSYPPTGIEHRHTAVSYPDLKVKKAQYTSGWWNVYIQIHTDKDGRVERLDVRRPESDGPLERIFVEQVKREVARWTFDPTPAEIIVDVRFFVE